MRRIYNCNIDIKIDQHYNENNNYNWDSNNNMNRNNHFHRDDGRAQQSKETNKF